MTLADSHCHLDDKQFDHDRDEVIDRALNAGVKLMLAIGSGEGPPHLEAAIRLAERYPFMLATVGVHPHDAAKAAPETFPALRDLSSHPKVAAIGEIGLDYHYDFSPRGVQRDVFTRQLHLAAECRKPIVVHTREAWDDTFSILEEHWSPTGLPGVMHCFSGGVDEARRALTMNFLLGFGGVVTYPKALAVRQAAAITPLDRILVETDAPYLAPVPHRGRRNEPAFLVHTAARLAGLRGEPLETLAAAATANFRRLCLPPAAANG